MASMKTAWACETALPVIDALLRARSSEISIELYSVKASRGSADRRAGGRTEDLPSKWRGP
jgi:hypothetical protein